MLHTPSNAMQQQGSSIPLVATQQKDATTHFAFLLVSEFSHIAFSCAIEPLRIANLVSGRQLYQWTLLSEDGKSATCSNQTVTLVNGGMQPLRHTNRLFVISGTNVQRHVSTELLSFLRRERANGTPLGAICSGVYILAQAGFLDGVEAAVHWEHRDLFNEKFPNIKVVNNIFVSSERIITSSGGVAAADLMLHIIAEQHGSGLAVEIADQMVHNSVREGSASQRISLQSRFGMRNNYITRAIKIMEDYVENPISPSEIAKEIGISTRQLERLFRRYLNTTPKTYFMDTRIQRARNLLVQTEQSITEIAMACGFQSISYFSKAFRARTGSPPMALRPFQNGRAARPASGRPSLRFVRGTGSNGTPDANA